MRLKGVKTRRNAPKKCVLVESPTIEKFQVSILNPYERNAWTSVKSQKGCLFRHPKNGQKLTQTNENAWLTVLILYRQNINIIRKFSQIVPEYCTVIKAVQYKRFPEFKATHELIERNKNSSYTDLILNIDVQVPNYSEI